MESSSNDWDLQAVVRSCSTAACSRGTAAVHHKEEEEAARPAVTVGAGAEFLWQQPAAATSFRGLDYSNQLGHEVPFSITPASDDELLISFPAAAEQPRKQQGGRRKPGVRAPRPKRRNCALCVLSTFAPYIYIYS
jgi:WRKY transcription factor 22